VSTVSEPVVSETAEVIPQPATVSLDASVAVASPLSPSRRERVEAGLMERRQHLQAVTATAPKSDELTITSEPVVSGAVSTVSEPVVSETPEVIPQPSTVSLDASVAVASPLSPSTVTKNDELTITSEPAVSEEATSVSEPVVSETPEALPHPADVYVDTSISVATPLSPSRRERVEAGLMERRQNRYVVIAEPKSNVRTLPSALVTAEAPAVVAEPVSAVNPQSVVVETATPTSPSRRGKVEASLLDRRQNRLERFSGSSNKVSSVENSSAVAPQTNDVPLESTLSSLVTGAETRPISLLQIDSSSSAVSSISQLLQSDIETKDMDIFAGIPVSNGVTEDSASSQIVLDDVEAAKESLDDSAATEIQTHHHGNFAADEIDPDRINEEWRRFHAENMEDSLHSANVLSPTAKLSPEKYKKSKDKRHKSKQQVQEQRMDEWNRQNNRHEAAVVIQKNVKGHQVRQKSRHVQFADPLEKKMGASFMDVEASIDGDSATFSVGISKDMLSLIFRVSRGGNEAVYMELSVKDATVAVNGEGQSIARICEQVISKLTW
jgi:hypothetical protein